MPKTSHSFFSSATATVAYEATPIAVTGRWYRGLLVSAMKGLKRPSSGWDGPWSLDFFAYFFSSHQLIPSPCRTFPLSPSLSRPTRVLLSLFCCKWHQLTPRRARLHARKLDPLPEEPRVPQGAAGRRRARARRPVPRCVGERQG